jgi:glycosyltransferase involved in cell wall biosynthesis
MAAIEECLKDFGPDQGLIEAAQQVRNQLGEPLAGDDVTNGPRLSLCMIVKNEEAHLAKCLASVSALVDEIIIVDTGSEDQTVKIAQVFGAKVFEYDWENDFSLARNYSLSKASGDWILILDADEVISIRDHDRLHGLMNRAAATAAYSITTRNYTLQANLVGWTANQGGYGTEEAGNGWYPSHKVRLFRNGQGIRFSYPIHELVEPSLKKLGIGIEPCPVPVHHYGKLNGQKNDEKALAYYALGIKKLEALADNAAAVREMAVQAAGLGKFAEAAELWNRFLKLDPNCADAYVNMGTACWNLGDYQSAARYAEKAITLAPNLKEAQFNLALSELFLGNTAKTVWILERLKLANPRYLPACFVLAAAYVCEDDREKARIGFDELGKTVSDLEYQTALNELSQKLTAAGQTELSGRLNHYESSRQPD